MISALLWLFFISTPGLSSFFIKNLESKTHPLLNIPDSISDYDVNILILGGGHTADPAIPNTGKLSNIALGRLIEGIRLHRTIPESKLILSGWGDSQSESQALVLFEAAKSLGVPDSSMVIISEPWNTKDEAYHYYKTYGTTRRLILVTDAVHMPRALFHFRSMGLYPIPAPTNYVVKKQSWRFRHDMIPSGQTISAFERTFHEYIGLLWAYLGGN
jgi:uncharacterized SAM-binding protein YcdF (DUF218 family)